MAVSTKGVTAAVRRPPGRVFPPWKLAVEWLMRITDIRETAVPLKSKLRNSSFDFSEMTTSVVALMTDVVRDGQRICGFAFNSTGRYACGAQMRERFIPRILRAEPESLLDGTGANFEPEKILARMLQREKSGGHSER